MTDRRERLHESLVEALAELYGTYPSLTWLGAEASPLLADEIDRTVKEGERGRLYAPDQYTLSFFPRDMEPWAANASQLRQDVSRGLRSCVKACGLLAIRDPHVTLASDPTLLPRQVRVIAWHSRDPVKFSRTLPVSEEGTPEEPPSGAFLVVGGRQPFPIRSAKSAIGRRLDNDIVLEDPHVSRRHAEIRLQENRYVVTDLESTAGTLVNGRPVQRHALTPGDVITIGGIQLIYG
ncbi:MAG: FhaA domain-containing protein, partial [Anaerolineales bacterium]